MGLKCSAGAAAGTDDTTGVSACTANRTYQGTRIESASQGAIDLSNQSFT